MKRTEIAARTEELVIPILKEKGLSLWDVEYVKEGADFYLRVYADKEGGITIDDCVAVSHELEAKLDEQDFIRDPYTLEVSSPGLTRPLKKPRDFQNSLGRLVCVKTYTPVDGQKEFSGILKQFDESTGAICVETDGAVREISKGNLSSARLEFTE